MLGLAKLIIQIVIVVYCVYYSKLWQMVAGLILVDCIFELFVKTRFNIGKREHTNFFLMIIFSIRRIGEKCIFFFVIFLLEKSLWEYFSWKTLLIEFSISAIVGVWIFIKKDEIFYRLGASFLILPSLLLDTIGIVLLLIALVVH